jgi:hypothetical protein
MGSTILMMVKCHHDIPSWFFFQFNLKFWQKNSKKLAKLVKATLGKISKHFKLIIEKRLSEKTLITKII